MTPAPMRSALLAAAVAGVATLGPPAAAAAPTFQVLDAGAAVPGFATADDVAGELVGPGVPLAGPASINGTTDASAYGAALPSFGRFSDGDADLGMTRGLVIGANARAGSFATGGFTSGIAPDRDDAELFGVVDAAGLCNFSTAANCTNNATSIEFAVTPTARFLKFEYALAVTEGGAWSPGGQSWSGNVFSYPDGFALFVGGRQVGDNCAVVPKTSTYLTMQTAGVVPPAGAGDNRSTAAALLALRVADQATPPLTPAGFAYSTQNPDWAVDFITVPLTCVADVTAEYLAGTPVALKIVVADVNDSAVPPAVFVKGDSVRFSDDPTPAPDPSAPVAPPPPASPVAPPPRVDDPAPRPGGPDPVAIAPRAPAAAVVTPLARPTVRRPPAGRRGRAAVVIHRLRFDVAGRYTFVYLHPATGRRVAQLPGSRVGRRVLTGRISAPVLRVATPGRRLVLRSRFPPRAFPRAGAGVDLRIVHRAPDGTRSVVTMDSGGRLS